MFHLVGARVISRGSGDVAALVIGRRCLHATLSRRFQTPSGIRDLIPRCKAPAFVALGLTRSFHTSGKALDKSPVAKLADVVPNSVSSVATAGGGAGIAQQTSGEEPEVDMLASVRTDWTTVKETFSLAETPREAFNIGLAGVVPYMATSLATVYCAWEINHNAGLVLSSSSAEALLHFLEPLQIGYGAVILSCLGTIHWGLEWAKYTGEFGYRRYMIGVLAPAVAWPTILLPVEYALISQFLAFNFLYFVDARATRRGWCPPWYGTYRFVLTFIVEASILASLVGRGQIADRIGSASAPILRLKAFNDAQELERLLREEEKKKQAEEEPSS